MVFINGKTTGAKISPLYHCALTTCRGITRSVWCLEIYLPHIDSSVDPSVTPHHTTVYDTCHTWTVLLTHLSRLITQQSAILATHGWFCCPICHASSHNSLQYLLHMDSSVAPSVTPHHTTVCNTCYTWTVLLPHLSCLITQQSAIPATHGQFCCPICHASSHKSAIPATHGQFCCPICHASSHNFDAK